MKVLIVHPNKGFHGGAEEVIAQLIKYLTDTGHEVLFVYEKSPYKLWRDTQTLANWADVINVHNFPATLATLPCRKPMVYMCNEPAEMFTNWRRKPIEALNRWWIRYSNMKVVVADEINAERFTRIYKREPEIVPYGVDYEFWSRHEPGILEATRNLREPFTLLQVGHLSLESFEVCLSTLRKIQIDIPKARLVLVGNARSKVQEDVITTGFLPNKGVRNWYHRASALLHPTPSCGGWLVPFEAMCAGLPVVTTTDFSAALLIDENNLGTVTGPEDMASWILDESYKELDTNKIKEWVRDNLTWEKFGERMLSVFEEAMNAS